jgi:hypothetical protein
MIWEFKGVGVGCLVRPIGNVRCHILLGKIGRQHSAADRILSDSISASSLRNTQSGPTLGYDGFHPLSVAAR